MKPNIVFITSDQQRRDSLGIYGCRYVSTPNLDRLGSQATVYEHCYCNAPVCTPSRACMMTGKTMPGHGVYNLFDILPENEKMLPYYLREQGYETALVGKLHVSGTEYEVNKRNPGDGFDIYDLAHEPSVYTEAPYNAYARWLLENYPDEWRAIRAQGRKRKHRSAETHFSTWVSQRSAEVIRNRDKSKPLYLQVGYFDPHNPYDHYPLESEQLLHPEYYPEVIPDDVSAMPEALQLEAHYHCPATLGATGDTNRKIRTGYFAGVSFLDQQIEKIFQALKDEGIFDNTLIIYTSDHGDMLGDHGLYSKGAMFYEQGVNVPLIVKFPHQTQGCRSEDLVMLEDMFSTIYTAAGGDASFRPESMPLQGEKKHEFAMTEYRGCGKFDLMGFPHILHATMIRTAEWKLNLYHDTCDGQLFHLTEDPQEKNNLYHDPACAGKIMELMQMYLRYDTERDYNYNAERGGRSGIPGFAKTICEIKL